MDLSGHSDERSKRPQGLLRATRRQALVGVASMASACGRRAPNLVAGEEGRIARIHDGDALAPDTGLRVRLAEVEAPASGLNDRPGEPFAEEAEAILAAAALRRRARLCDGGLNRDRYDRAIAHAIASDETGADIWLNGLVEWPGGARVRSFSRQRSPRPPALRAGGGSARG